MAISPADTYPGQVDLSDPAGWPYGAARNITVPGDGTGWPLERDWVNDLLGFEQALLDAAGLTPTGTPDKVGASQYLDAIEEIINSHEFTDGLHVSAGAVQFDAGLLVTAGGLTVANGLIVSSDGAIVTGNSSITGDLAVSGALSVNGTVTLGNAISDVVTVTGGLIARTIVVLTTTELLGSLTVATDLTVSGATALEDTLSVAGPATFDDTAEFNGVVTFNAGIAMGSALVGGTLAMQGAGHVRGRLVTLIDSSPTKGIDDGDYYYLPDNVLSVPRTLTLSHTNAGAGDVIEVACWDNTNTLSVDDATAGNLAILKNASSFANVMRFVYDGSQWQKFASWEVP